MALYCSWGTRLSLSIMNSQMVSGDKCGLNYLTFVLQLKENPRKTSTRKLTRPGFEPTPLMRGNNIKIIHFGSSKTLLNVKKRCLIYRLWRTWSTYLHEETGWLALRSSQLYFHETPATYFKEDLRASLNSANVGYLYCCCF